MTFRERDASEHGLATSAGARAFEHGPWEWGALYDEHFAFVWRTLRRYGVPEPSLEDAVQDVFLVVHAQLAKFEGRSSLRTWVFGIVRRVARNHRPSKRLRGVGVDELEALPDAAAQSALVRLEHVEAAGLMEDLLSRLSAKKREAFILVELEEMTILEASHALDVNANTIAARVRAARLELKQAIAKLEVSRARRERCAT